MKRRIVEVLELAGGGVVLLLECLHEILRIPGSDPLTRAVSEGEQYVLCTECPRSRAERQRAAQHRRFHVRGEA